MCIKTYIFISLLFLFVTISVFAETSTTPTITNALWYPKDSLLRVTIIGKPTPDVNVISGQDMSITLSMFGTTTMDVQIPSTTPVKSIKMSQKENASVIDFVFTEPIKYRVYRYNLEGDEGGYLIFIKKLSEVGSDIEKTSDNISNGGEKVTDGKEYPLRRKPDDKSKIVGYITKDDKVDVMEEQGEWFRVRTGSVEGWVKKRIVNIKINTGDSIRDSIITVCISRLGDPYVYGGDTPGGFDCSGLVYYAYKSVGVEIPRGAEEQFSSCKVIDMKIAKPADLIFFSEKKSGGISHVGIYLGGGRFIHAETTEDGITISSLDEDYWKRRFSCIKTFLER
ncbi:MAG: C40 family peptidase [bacterium]